MGHAVVPYMFVPPSTNRFTVSGFCSSECTSRVCLHRGKLSSLKCYDDDNCNIIQFIPEEGIRIFANFMHTHLVGKLYDKHYEHTL